MTLRRISSMLTFVYKFILPFVCVLGILNYIRIFGDAPFERQMTFFAVAIMVGVSAFEFWATWNIKRVLLDETNSRIYVSNFRREIAIPISEIVDVSQFSLHDPKRVTIHLRTPTEFGEKIVFLAPYQFGGSFGRWFSTHPVVNELRQLAGLKGEIRDLQI